MEAAGGDEAVEEVEGAAFGEMEVRFEVVAEEAGVGGKVLCEEGGDLGIGDFGATGLENMLKASMTVDFAQKLVVGLELNGSDMQVVDLGTSGGTRNFALNTRREGAEAVDIHSTAFGQEFRERVGHIYQDADAATLGIDATATVHRT